jgi:carbon monoxide dehydrogenase subunit G
VNIRVAIEIDAPPAVVWQTVENIEHHVDWMADAETIRFTTEEHADVGTAFDCETKVGPFRLTDKMRVTEWEPERAMGIEHEGLVAGRGRFTLTLIGTDRTRFSWEETLTFPAKMGGAAGAFAAKPVLTQVWRRNLRRLKNIVESRSQ